MLRRGGGRRLPEPRLDAQLDHQSSKRETSIPEISEIIMEDVEDVVGESLDRSSYCETREGFYVNVRTDNIRHLARINESLAHNILGAECSVSSQLDDFGNALYRLSVKNIDPSVLYDDDDDGESDEDAHYRSNHHHHNRKKKKRKNSSRCNCGGCLQGVATGVLMSATLAIYLIFFK